MRLITLLTIIGLIICSCNSRQDRTEEKVFKELGNSFVDTVSEYLVSSFKFLDVPPAPPEYIKSFYSDTIEGKALLTKYDTLAYPYKVSVLGHGIITDTSLFNKYVNAFKEQNRIRISYICENIVIIDSLLRPTSEIFKEIYQEEIQNKYSRTNFMNFSPRFLPEAAAGMQWNSEKLHDADSVIADLQATKIQFYRIIFNESFDQGLLLANINLHGYMSIYSFFTLEKDKVWKIVSFRSFWFNKNDKRWTRQ
jgi:hypothetical protein